MSTIKSSNEHLTLNADGSSKDIKFQANGVEKASISSAGAFTSTTIDATKLTGDLPAISGASLTNLPSKGKNIFINGDMGVAQRGTITSLTTSQYSTCDRWNVNINDAGTWTTTQDTDVPAGQGFLHSLKLDCTTADASVAAASFLRLQYRPESQDLKQARWGTSDAQPLVMSFWIKFDNLTGDFCTDVLSLDNSNNRTVSQKFTYGTAGAWQKCVFTIPADTGGNTLGADTGGDTYFQIFLQAGSDVTSGTLNTTWATRVNANRAAGQTIQAASNTSNNVYLTGCQLELGSTATDFEYRTYGEQLALCQRYYQAVEGAGGAYEFDGLYASGAGNGLGINYPFPVEMRASPTLTVLFNDTGNIATQQNTATKQGIFVGGQTSSDGRTSMKRNSSGYVRLNAEL